jgi:hypothetical protein
MKKYDTLPEAVNFLEVRYEQPPTAISAETVAKLYIGDEQFDRAIDAALERRQAQALPEDSRRLSIQIINHKNAEKKVFNSLKEYIDQTFGPAVELQYPFGPPVVPATKAGWLKSIGMRIKRAFKRNQNDDTMDEEAVIQMRLRVLINRQANLIAARTRRGCGNVLYTNGISVDGFNILPLDGLDTGTALLMYNGRLNDPTTPIVDTGFVYADTTNGIEVIDIPAVKDYGILIKIKK